MFSVLVSSHPLWKYVFRPADLSPQGEGKSLIDNWITKQNQEQFDLEEWQKEIVSLYEMTSESYVMKRLVRDKLSVAEFQKKFGSSFPNYELIIQSVERANYKIARLLVQHQVPVFFKKKKYFELYLSDKVDLPLDFDESLPSFVLENDTLHYSLKIKSQEKISAVPFLIDTKEVAVLCSEPCCMVIRSRLYLFEKTNYKKIATFFMKRTIEVPSQSVPTYMQSFVKKTIATEDVVVQGFSLNRRNYTIQPILSLEEDLDGIVALKLAFEYGDQRVEMDCQNERLVKLHEGSSYSFDLLIRDLIKEKAYADALLKLGLKQKNRFYYVDNKKQEEKRSIIDFLVHYRTDLSEYKIEQNIKESSYVLEPVTYEIELDDSHVDWFELKGVVRVGDIEIPFAHVRNHIIEGCREYRLPDGRIVILPEELFTKYSELMRMTEKGDNLRIRRSLIGMMEDTFSNAKNIRLRMSELEKVPDSLRATLRPYQEVGYSWLVKLYNLNYGGCLADDMGLGKTLQFLSFLLYVYPVVKKEEKKSRWIYETSEPSLFDQPVEEPVVQTTVSKAPTLVIMPTSLVFNWIHEKNKFAPTLTHYVYGGEKRIRSSQIGKVFSHYNLIFTTYGMIRNDIEYLKNCEFECIIMDESQNLKNASSLIYKAVVQLKTNHFYCMTGTPIENGMMDLWTQMNIINRDMLGSQTYFHRFFEQPIIKEKNEERDALLRQIIKPFILRRKKKDVIKELPDKFIMEVYCEMSEEHRKAYESYKSAIRNKIMDDIFSYGKPQEMTLALSSLTLMRQMANQVSLIEEDKDIASTKVDEIMMRLENLKEEGHKVLVFSNFVKFLEVIEKKIQERNYSYSKITGSVKRRDVEVEKFQNDPDTFCFLISLKAGGVGLNLTAADYVFLIDPWWNPAAEQQAEDRAYRIGQMNNVMVYRFIMKDTIEEKVLQLQNKKRTLADSFINQNNPFDSFDKSDWEDLFK